MFCKKCGKELEDNVRFCNYCGTEVENKVVDFNEAAGNNKPDNNYANGVDSNIIMNMLCHSNQFRQQPDSQ